MGACAPSLNDVNYPAQCRFDNSPFDSLQPDVKKGNGLLNAHYQLTDTTQLYAELSFAQVETLTQVQPVPLSYQNPLLPSNPFLAYQANLLATQYPTYHNPAITPTAAAFLLPPTSPYYPTAFAAANGMAGLPLNLIYRDFANGPRLEDDTSDTTRAVGGWKGNLAGWDFDTSILYSQVKVKEDLKSGFPLYSEIMPILDSGIINPFGPTTDPSALAAAKGAEFVGQDWSSETSLTSLSGHASRALFDLPGGPFSAAVGAEVRRETFIYNPSGPIQTGDITGEGGNQLPENAARSVESAYLEVNMPIVHSLDADAAVRYDHYQNIGSTVNPKGSLKFQPVDWWLLRASVGSGFRAPSLTDLYAAQATSVTSNGTRDPIKCPTFDPNNPACSFQFTTVTGGNPEPETGKVDHHHLWHGVRTNEELDSWLGYLLDLLEGYDCRRRTSGIGDFAKCRFRDAVCQPDHSRCQWQYRLHQPDQRESLQDECQRHGCRFQIRFRRRRLRANQLFCSTALTTTNSPNRIRTVAGPDEIDKGISTEPGVISRWRHTASLVYSIGDLGRVAHRALPEEISRLRRQHHGGDSLRGRL